MIINFRAHEINQDERKLTQILMLIKKINKNVMINLCKF